MINNITTTIDLKESCRRESERYQKGRSVRKGACYELFRRAIVDKDQEAWAGVYEQYRRLVITWLQARHHQDHNEVDELVNEAFAKFWRAVKPETFVRDFAGIGKVMAFLRLCARSVKVDRIRKQKKAALISINEIELTINDSTALAVLGHIQQDNIREQIQLRLKNDQERLLFYLSFEIGLKPRQIADNYTKEFENVKEVRRIKERIVLRLRKDAQLQAWWANRS